jgi:hypothetical protein
MGKSAEPTIVVSFDEAKGDQENQYCDSNVGSSNLNTPASTHGTGGYKKHYTHNNRYGRQGYTNHHSGNNYHRSNGYNGYYPQNNGYHHNGHYGNNNRPYGNK